MNATTMKWTKDNPKESGWYYCYCNAFTSVTIVRVCIDDNSLYASDISDETHTPFDFYRMYRQHNLRWLKIDIPALPEEGEEL